MRKLLLAWFLVSSFLACKEEPVDPGDTPPGDSPDTPAENYVVPLEIEARYGEEITSGLPAWAEGDCISFYGKGLTHAKLTFKSASEGKALFDGNGVSLGPYYAIYPYNESNTLADGMLGLCIPAEQKLTGGQIAPGALAAVATGLGKSLTFVNVCGVLELTVAVEGVSSIHIRSLSDTPLAGQVTVDPKTGGIKATANSSMEMTLLPAGETFAPGTYYAAVIPANHLKGLEITLSGTLSLKKAVIKVDELDIQRSRAVNPGALTTESASMSYQIGSYEDLLAWVADKPNWNPEGEVVTLTADINMKDEPWTPLTDSYSGVFDGAGHCISHINIESSTLAHTGFFGKGYAKEIKNLILGSEDGSTYDGTSRIVCSYQTTSTSSYWCYAAPITQPVANITNVTNFIPVTVTKSANRSSRAGGIVSWVTGTVSIDKCKNYGDVTIEEHEITSGSSYKYVTAGGIIGGQNTDASKVMLTECVNYGKVSSNNHCCYGLGGIVGLIYSTANKLVIDGCVNEGDVELLYSATQNDMFAAGGIIGKVACKAGTPEPPMIRQCVNNGHVRSEAVHQHYVGGIAGRADGAIIAECNNEGAVEIDHRAHASTRFQNVGGILGAAMADGGENTVSNNSNTGQILMCVASSGHNKTPSSSSTFYGVNAGGILGMGGGVLELSGNVNQGDIEAENSFVATGTYPATLHVGGILGYDYGAIDNIKSNSFAGILNARTTGSGSVPSEVYVGGMVGRLRAATIGNGSVSCEIHASYTNLGKIYAGAVAGYNDGTIVSCNVRGDVNGAEAGADNMVGGGKGVGSDNPGPVQGFGVSDTRIDFPGTGFTAKPLVISAGDKNITISLAGLDWIKTDGIPSTLAAGSSQTVSIVPLTGNIDENRSGTLTVSEEGGKSVSVAISQDGMYTAVNGFPARWEIVKGVTYTEGNDAGRRWLNEGIAATVAYDDVASNPPGTGYISAGSTTGNKLVYSVAPSGTQNISIGNLGEGDYIQFSVPVLSLPAGTDVDFMVTINTNNNKTPKYWLFEYWDDGKWNSQPRYTASEDASVKYSFDVYDYDSKNHRTYITTFRLSKAVEGAFVKMRVRAVGKVNCAGNTLVPTANAYMNFPCTTYRACEIVAYPGVPAKEAEPLKLLQLGNSFTYYHGSAFKLKQICRAEGHATDVRINVKGSQEFAEHLDVLPFSQRLLAEGGYDRAIIQDGSYYHAEYAAGKDALKDVTPEYTPEEILKYTKRLSAAIKDKSPNAKVILESVWSYPYKSTGGYLGFGSFEKFDEMQWKGSTAIMEADPNTDMLSPIGKAFALARSTEYGFRENYNWLLYTDNYHPGRYGSYLKACVNYLVLFGEPFGEHPADCDVPAAEAAKLRAVAEKIVLGK